MQLRRFGLTFLVVALLPGLSFAQTEVSGHVNDGTTWTESNSPYLVTGDIHVDKDSTLTIEAGVVIKFQYNERSGGRNNGKAKRSLFVKGTLDLEGTDSDPVVFTSSRDDSYAGDTNGDGNETTPSRGDWGYIKFVSQANVTNVFEHAVVRYGGKRDDDRGAYVNDFHNYQIWVTSPDATYDDVTIRDVTIEKTQFAGIHVDNASPTIDNVTIREAGDAIELAGSYGRPAKPAIKNSTIKNNRQAPVAQYGYAFPSYSGNTIESNGRQAITVGGTFEASESTSERWPKVQDLPYFVNQDIRIKPNVTLSVAAGTVIKFQYNERSGGRNNGKAKRSLFVKGTLDLEGTDSDPVVFTSSRDDSYAGDTNGDGNETTPSRGDWGYIKFVSQANVTNVFEHAVVRYGGKRDDDRSDFDDNFHNYQIWVTSPDATYDDVTIRYNTFEKIHKTAIRVDGEASPSVKYNNITESPNFGLNNNTGSAITAENNWWGDASGPSHSSNPDGSGVKVSDNVDFDPWQEERVTVFIAAPTGLIARAGDGKVTLNWDSNTESKLAGYNVYRDTIPNPTNKIATLAADKSSYEDTGVTNDTTYYYRVTALTKDGDESDYSKEVSTTPSIVPIYGDITEDGNVSAFDGARTLQHVAGLNLEVGVPLTGRDSIAAEVTGNGDISALDASLIFQYSVGLIKCFPVESGCSTQKGKWQKKQKTGGLPLAWGEQETQGKTVRLPVRVEQGGSVYGVELDLEYPDRKFQFRSIEASLPDGWNVAKQTEGEGLELAFAGMRPHDGGRLATIVLEQRKEGFRADIRASSQVNERSRETMKPITIGEEPETLTLKGNYPNPASERTTLPYTLPEQQHVRLVVYDVLGRRVQILVDESQRAGLHQDIKSNFLCKAGCLSGRLKSTIGGF
jgi:hypothetical protein